MKHRHFLKGISGLALVFSLAFIGCGDDGGGDPTPPPQPPEVSISLKASGQTAFSDIHKVVVNTSTAASYTFQVEVDGEVDTGATFSVASSGASAAGTTFGSGATANVLTIATAETGVLDSTDSKNYITIQVIPTGKSAQAVKLEVVTKVVRSFAIDADQSSKASGTTPINGISASGKTITISKATLAADTTLTFVKAVTGEGSGFDAVTWAFFQQDGTTAFTNSTITGVAGDASAGTLTLTKASLAVGTLKVKLSSTADTSRTDMVTVTITESSTPSPEPTVEVSLKTGTQDFSDIHKVVVNTSTAATYTFQVKLDDTVDSGAAFSVASEGASNATGTTFTGAVLTIATDEVGVADSGKNYITIQVTPTGLSPQTVKLEVVSDVIRSLAIDAEKSSKASGTTPIAGVSASGKTITVSKGSIGDVTNVVLTFVEAIAGEGTSGFDDPVWAFFQQDGTTALASTIGGVAGDASTGILTLTKASLATGTLKVKLTNANTDLEDIVTVTITN